MVQLTQTKPDQQSHSAERRKETPPLPTVSLPKGGGAIHGIGEKFAANPVTGTGSMTVPIATSPGRSGFGPQLSLSYDSGAGNGPFGFGWSLSLPQITRKTDKGLPQYNDAVESDVFILPGAEDLVPELEKDAAGNWVIKDGKYVIHDEPRTVDGVTYRVRRYRPRIEGLFARIARWTKVETGETHWRSITRDNVTTLYGKDNNSRIFDPADPSPANPTRVFSWLMCESYSGYVRQPTQNQPNRYLKKSLPPLEFDYTQIPSPEQLARQPIREVDAESLENLPVGLDGASYQWIDLDGEGTSGILTEQADAWFYKRNRSANNVVWEDHHERTIARFGPAELVASKPALGLAGGGQFLDLSGDHWMKRKARGSSSPTAHSPSTWLICQVTDCVISCAFAMGKPAIGRTWFPTGVFVDRDRVSTHLAHEYYGAPDSNDPDYDNKLQAFLQTLPPDTVLPVGLTGDEEREACRALKGSMLRQEIDALDGTDKEDHPYTVVEQDFTMLCLILLLGNPSEKSVEANPPCHSD